MAICDKCGLAKTRYNVLQGKGPIPADILFISDYPSTGDDLTGVLSTELLDQMIDGAGLRGKSLYFVNCIMCRPCDSRGGASREPTPLEVITCRDNILGVINSVCPSNVVLVGDLAKKHFKRIFPHATCITHPSVLMRLGGKRAPNYIDNIHKLEAILSC